MSTRQTKITLVSAGLILILGILMLVSTSLAWLDVSRIPFISDVTVSVITDNDLKIALDDKGEPGEWQTYLDASEIFELKAPLKPVTYKDGTFHKLLYNELGRTAGVTPITEDDINAPILSENVSSAVKTTAGDSGCILAVDFWLKTDGSPADVTLKDPKEIEDGEINRGSYAVGMPVWDETQRKHINGAYGSETTLRLGFEVWLSDEDGELPEKSEFFIYEPNADIHPGGEEGYLETRGIGDTEYIDSDHLIIQNASLWEDVRPAEEDKLNFKAGEFTQNRKLFTLDGKNLAKVRLWIWVEGQDPDCYALTYADAAEILCDVEFGVEESGHETGIERR